MLGLFKQLMPHLHIFSPPWVSVIAIVYLLISSLLSVEISVCWFSSKQINNIMPTKQSLLIFDQLTHNLIKLIISNINWKVS